MIHSTGVTHKTITCNSLLETAPNHKNNHSRLGTISITTMRVKLLASAALALIGAAPGVFSEVMLAGYPLYFSIGILLLI